MQTIITIYLYFDYFSLLSNENLLVFFLLYFMNIDCSFFFLFFFFFLKSSYFSKYKFICISNLVIESSLIESK